MIYITGDTHIPYDVRKLNAKNFPIGRLLTKDDFVIVMGDFGGIWHGSKEDVFWLNWLDKKPWTTLFIDGNHENFDVLNKFPVMQWKGGNVHKINDSIYHLMRGEVFDLDQITIFTMGGANSKDAHKRKEGVDWWPQELPTWSEINYAIENLNQVDWKVDLVLTHAMSNNSLLQIGKYPDNTILNQFFDVLEEKLEYNMWCNGHYHLDMNLSDNHQIVYNHILEVVSGKSGIEFNRVDMMDELLKERSLRRENLLKRSL